MPIRIPARLINLQPSCRPSRILHRGIVPPRTGTQTQTRHQLFARIPTPPTSRNMSSSSSTTSTRAGNNQPPAPSAASPAPTTSTPPLPGSSPSASPAAAAAAPVSSNSSSGGGAPTTTTTTTTTPSMAAGGETQPTVDSSNDNAIPPSPLPALPEPSPSGEGENEGTTTVHVNGQPVALDSLGPMVVNRDGTLARIANWHEMADIERENTLRILGKRNQLRLGNLRAGLAADSKGSSD